MNKTSCGVWLQAWCQPSYILSRREGGRVSISYTATHSKEKPGAPPGPDGVPTEAGLSGVGPSFSLARLLSGLMLRWGMPQTWLGGQTQGLESHVVHLCGGGLQGFAGGSLELSLLSRCR